MRLQNPGMAIQRLEGFVDLVRVHLVGDKPSVARLMAAISVPEDRLINEAPLVEAILQRVQPDWADTVPLDDRGRWWQMKEAAQRAATLLAHERELWEMLGDNVSRLEVTRLHPWVWRGASSMWASGQYGQAVVEALKMVNAQTQKKAGRRDLTETDLFQQLFTTDSPKPNRPRLRLLADDGSGTYSSVHRGAQALAEGLFAGIRNPHAHEVTDTPTTEQRALEQLAAVSVLARWVNDAEVVTAP